jgi:ABC-type branched-subunit amino acid transport system substrate-binding protein
LRHLPVSLLRPKGLSRETPLFFRSRELGRQAEKRKGVDRRRFLILGSAATLAYATGDVLMGGPLSTLLSSAVGTQKGKLPPEVSIGVVYPLSGRLEGWASEALPFINIAEADVNGLPQAKAAGVRFSAVVRSSDATGEGALAAVKDLVEKEHVLVIAGLPVSEELMGSIQYLTENGIAAVSSASTSPSPTLMKRDTVFRIMPSELYMARRLAELAMHLGYRRAAVIHRTDEWGNAYSAEVMSRFKSLGYQAAEVGIVPTHPNVTDYATQVKQLSDRVAELGADGKTVAIMAVWEGEDLNILHHAAEDPTLSGVRWLSAVLYPSLLTGQFEASGIDLPDARDFALSHQMWGGENHPPSNALLRRIWTQAKGDLGHAPRFEHVYLYDAIQVVARAMMLAGAQDGRSVAASIPAAVKGYDPATGPIGFDENGERATGDLAYYGLFKNGTQYEYRYYSYFHDDSPNGSFQVLQEPEVRETEFCPEC